MLFGKLWGDKVDNFLKKCMTSHWFWIYLFVIVAFGIISFIDFITTI